MPTTPTSLVNRLMGAEAFTDALSFPAGTKIGGLTVDSANRLLAVAAATTTLTLTPAAHSAKILLLSSTGGLAITPPAATGTGDCYSFIVTTTISGGSVTLDAKAGNASDVFAGMAQMVLSAGTTVSGFPTASTSNLITINGTTTGGVAGTYIEILDVATHQWLVLIQALQTGTAATPFSNH